MSIPVADFDGAWSYALEQYMPACLQLFFPQVYAGIDWRVPLIFADKELQQINPEANTGKLRVDKLIQVRRHNRQPLVVFVHLEIQAQRDTSFAKRMYRYHTRLFDRNDTPVVSLAILADDDPDWHLRSVEGQLELVLRQMTRKVGPIDAAVRERIAALPHNDLLRLSEALLDFSSHDDLVTWLALA